MVYIALIIPFHGCLRLPGLLDDWQQLMIHRQLVGDLHFRWFYPFLGFLEVFEAIKSVLSELMLVFSPFPPPFLLLLNVQKHDSSPNALPIRHLQASPFSRAVALVVRHLLAVFATLVDLVLAAGPQEARILIVTTYDFEQAVEHHVVLALDLPLLLLAQ